MWLLESFARDKQTMIQEADGNRRLTWEALFFSSARPFKECRRRLQHELRQRFPESLNHLQGVQMSLLPFSQRTFGKILNFCWRAGGLCPFHFTRFIWKNVTNQLVQFVHTFQLLLSGVYITVLASIIQSSTLVKALISDGLDVDLMLVELLRDVDVVEPWC